MDHLSISCWQTRFQEGKFQSSAVYAQCLAGWYDWFCRDDQLFKKTARLGKIVCRIKDGGKVNRDDWYVWFKNNCPCVGPLYDDIRLARLDTGKVQMTITVKDRRNDHLYVVYGVDPSGVGHWGEAVDGSNDGDCLFATDSVAQLVSWLNRSWNDEKGGF